MGDNSKWWEPGYYWPRGFPDLLTIENYTAVCIAHGFEKCETLSFEPGFEKIVLYADSDGDFSHAARQEGETAWSSKIGEYIDIEHTLEGLDGGRYGNIEVILKRPSLVGGGMPTPSFS